MKADDIKRFERLNSIDLPKDNDSEEGVVGTIITHPEYILKSEFLKPNQFYNRELGCIYHVVNDLYKNGITEINQVLIETEIKKNEGYYKIFDKNKDTKLEDYILDLKLKGVETQESYELLCENVITQDFKRETYIKLNQLQDNIIKTNEDINSINYRLQKTVTDFSKIYIGNNEIKTLGEQADEIWQGIMDKRTSGFFGFPSKFHTLNNYTSYEKTELVTIASPGKTGKSQFLANEAWNMIINGNVPTCYIDRELSTENHMVRFLAYLTGIGSRNIKTGNISLAEEKLVKEKLEFIKKLPYVHIYKPVTEMEDLFLEIKSLQLKHEIEFLVYDYIKANDQSDSDKEYQKLGRLTDWLKNEVAGQLNLACLTATQMDDKGTKIADSQKILRNSSTILYLLRKSMEEVAKDGRDSGNMKLICHANRNGQIMQEGEYINLVLNGDIATLKEAKNGFTEAELPY